MSHADATPTDDSPWDDSIDATHLTGDIYFINQHATWVWIAACMATLVLPPAGAFALSWMVCSGLTTDTEAVTVTPR